MPGAFLAHGKQLDILHNIDKIQKNGLFIFCDVSTVFQTWKVLPNEQK